METRRVRLFWSSIGKELYAMDHETSKVNRVVLQIEGPYIEHTVPADIRLEPDIEVEVIPRD